MAFLLRCDGKDSVKNLGKDILSSRTSNTQRLRWGKPWRVLGTQWGQDIQKALRGKMYEKRLELGKERIIQDLVVWWGLWPAVSMVLWMQWTKSHRLQMSCGERDSMATLWVREHPDTCLDRLLLLSGSITSREVLIHYAQVCFRWLCLTDNKDKNVANAREW